MTRWTVGKVCGRKPNHPKSYRPQMSADDIFTYMLLHFGHSLVPNFPVKEGEQFYR